MNEDLELLDPAPVVQVDRECPECEGRCYDDDDAPCLECYGEGVVGAY